MEKIIRYLINRPIVTKLTMTFILCLALLTLTKIQRNSYPPVDLHRIDINTVYPGASPEDVEVNITAKIENAIKHITGIKYTESKSMENFSRVTVTLDQDYENLDSIKDEIRREVDNIPDLPQDLTEKPTFFETKVDNFPIYDVALIWPGKKIAQIRRHVNRLQKEFEKIPEVSKAVISGERQKEIQVQLVLKRLNYLGVSFDEVIAAIKNSKLRLSGGQIESFIYQKGILTLSEFDSLDEVKEIIVRSNEAGKRVRINDIAYVRYAYEKQNIITRYNGREGMALWLYKKPKADVIDTVNKIKKKIEQYKKDFAPNEMSFITTHDTSIETHSRLTMVGQNVLLGLVLVLLTLLLFFNYQIAIWCAVGIPISLGISIIFLPVFGITLNSISLCGVIVVLGMIVDDAIIISESIYRERRDSVIDDSIENVISGVRKVIKPVTSTIVTTVIAFIPIFFIPGMIGQFTREIPAVVSIILFASLVEACLFLPVHLHSIAKEGKDPIGQRLIDFLEDKYESVLAFLIGRKFISLIFLLVSLSGGMWLLLRDPHFELFPIEQASRLYIHGKVTPGHNLEFTAKQASFVEDELKKIPPEIVLSYRTRIGRSFLDNNKCTRCFYIKIELTPFSQRKQRAKDVENMLLASLRSNGNKELTDIGARIDTGAPPMGPGVEIHVTGENNEKRLQAIEELKEKISSLSLKQIQSNFEPGAPIIKLIPDHKTISRVQTNVSDIAQTIRVAYEGAIVSHIQKTSEKIPFRVVLGKSSLNFEDPLDGLKVLNSRKRLIPLDNLVTRKEESGASVIHHYNNERSNTITAELKSSNKKAIYNNIKEIMLPIVKKYTNLSFDIGGEAKKSGNAFRESLFSFGIAILAIYFFLVVQFNSFVTPFIIVSTIPFGLLGILLSFKLHGLPISFMAMIGIIGFSGVVINDSLVMVDLIDRIKKLENTDPVTAIITGAKKRMRPILLTTITTIAGLLPSIYGVVGDTDAFISPMVLAMGSGLCLGTLSVLLFIPVLYASTLSLIRKSE